MNPEWLKAALAIAGLAGLLLAGCAGTGPSMKGGETGLKTDAIIDLTRGTELTARQLIDRLGTYRIVFLGEYHDHPVIHQRQVEIVQGLWAKNISLVVGLEVFSREQQGLLDDWVGGRLDEKEFEARVAGKILSGETYGVYYSLLAWAREKGVPLLALNAPREVTAKVARNGLAGLDEADRAKIAKDIVVGPDSYRQRVQEALGGHHGAMNLDNFFSAQVVWDETMAETLTNYLTSDAGRMRQAVVIAGNQHVWEGLGTPDRVKRRMKTTQAIVLMPQTTWEGALTAEDADYAWVAPVIEAPPRPRLGVVLKSENGRLLVAEVVPSSEAERIGLQPGDRLVELDGRPVKDAMDLHRAAMERGVDADHRLTYERSGSRFEIGFRFRIESK